MSLASFQNALAAMVMDESFAKAVREDSVHALAAFDLDLRERERLAGIAAQPGLRLRRLSICATVTAARPPSARHDARGKPTCH